MSVRGRHSYAPELPEQECNVQNYGNCLLAPEMLQKQAELWPTKKPQKCMATPIQNCPFGLPYGSSLTYQNISAQIIPCLIRTIPP